MQSQVYIGFIVVNKVIEVYILVNVFIFVAISIIIKINSKVVVFFTIKITINDSTQQKQIVANWDNFVCIVSAIIYLKNLLQVRADEKK